jgi:glycosyltransferase involved in cell wall biosynthesis
MRIALDATPLSVPTGGIRRYAEELSRALAENFADDEFWLLSSQAFVPARCPAANLKCGRGPGNVLERRWFLWGVQREIARLRIDLFHGTDFSVPYVPVRPSVMTVHDLSPWMNESWADSSWRAASSRVRRRTPILLRMGLATMVITPSEAIRRKAIQQFGLEPSRVVAVPLAAARIFRPAQAPCSRSPYLLYVGTLEPRKNLIFLLEVWREVCRENPVDLILAGGRRPTFPKICEPGLHLLGAVTDEELPKLYSGALACLYPSLYEGFGMPVLEAMQCGAVVIASRDPAIAELAQDAAVLLDAANRRAWIETLRSVIKQPERFKPFRDKGLARAGQFSWDKTAKLTREVYAQAVERFRK